MQHNEALKSPFSVQQCRLQHSCWKKNNNNNTTNCLLSQTDSQRQHINIFTLQPGSYQLPVRVIVFLHLSLIYQNLKYPSLTPTTIFILSYATKSQSSLSIHLSIVFTLSDIAINQAEMPVNKGKK